MFKLNYPRLISPFWLNTPQLSGVVLADGAVRADREVLDLHSGELPPVGTKVILWMRPDFLVGMSEAEVLAEKEKERLEQQRLLEKDRLAAEQRKREVFESIRSSNARIKIPVRWTSGRKVVLSGLSEGSDGSGLKKNSVCHILLLEPVNEGRFNRPAQSFLCTTEGGSNGKEWTEGLHCHTEGPEGRVVSRITCSACLRTAQRWSSLNDGYNVAPEVV